MALPMLRININQINKPALTDRNNNNLRVRVATKKCLFGPADPIETEKLVQEQFKNEKQRFFERFGIDMEDLENIAVEQGKYELPSGKMKMSHEKTSKRSRVLKPYNTQTKMTDFCQVKKSPTTALLKKL